MLIRAKEMKATKDDVSYAKYLRQMGADFRGTSVEVAAMQSLEELAMEMLSRQRDANYERDWNAKNEADRQLREGFADDKVLRRVLGILAVQEIKARDLFRRGQRHEKGSNNRSAVQRYENIVKNYPGTLTARKAQDRLTELLPRQSRSSTDDLEAELSKMMQQ